MFLKSKVFQGFFDYVYCLKLLYLRAGRCADSIVFDLCLDSVIKQICIKIFIHEIYLVIRSIVDYKQLMIGSKQLLIVVLASIATVLLYDTANQTNIQTEFRNWCSQYQQEFQNYEFIYRLQIYKSNNLRVKKHNQLAEQGKRNYFMTLNQFAATTQKQYKYQFGQLNMKHNILPTITTKCTGSIQDAPNPPPSLNWTEKAVDSFVQLEGKCSANWAFTAVAAVEGIYAIKNDKVVKFSDQQLIDCSADYGNEGCGGGYMDQAFWYMIDQGLAANKSYPYAGIKQNCKYSQSQKVVKVAKCAKVPSGIHQKLVSAVIQQPVSVAIASQMFMLYDRGIYDGDCTLQLDRGMLLVGYGTQDEKDFWILKNSLGSSWGEKGYMRLKKTAADGPGLCGIQLAPSVPQGVE